MLATLLTIHLLGAQAAAASPAGPAARLVLLPELHAAAGPAATATTSTEASPVETGRLGLHLAELGLSVGALLVTEAVVGGLGLVGVVAVAVAVVGSFGGASSSGVVVAGLVAAAISFLAAGTLQLLAPVVPLAVDWLVARASGDPGVLWKGVLGSALGAAPGAALALVGLLISAASGGAAAPVGSALLWLGGGAAVLGVCVGATVGLHWGVPLPGAAAPAPAVTPELQAPPSYTPPPLPPTAPPPAARLVVPLLSVELG